MESERKDKGLMHKKRNFIQYILKLNYSKNAYNREFYKNSKLDFNHSLR